MLKAQERQWDARDVGVETVAAVLGVGGLIALPSWLVWTYVTVVTWSPPLDWAAVNLGLSAAGLVATRLGRKGPTLAVALVRAIPVLWLRRDGRVAVRVE